MPPTGSRQDQHRGKQNAPVAAAVGLWGAVSLCMASTTRTTLFMITDVHESELTKQSLVCVWKHPALEMLKVL